MWKGKDPDPYLGLTDPDPQHCLIVHSCFYQLTINLGGPTHFAPGNLVLHFLHLCLKH
jgi:hypothetical protein